VDSLVIARSQRVRPLAGPMINSAMKQSSSCLGLLDCFVASAPGNDGTKKGPQLALEPLNGQGIAGYLPEPELWARSVKTAPRENTYIL
jgi:hypothetical protein